MKFVSSCLVFLLILQRTLGTCPEGFTEDASTGESVCSPIPNYKKAFKDPGESCSLATECDSSKNFECIDGTCQCNPATSVIQERKYTNSQGMPENGVICSVKVGSPCTSPSHICVFGATCNATAGNICTCLADFTLTSENLCGRSYGKPCSPTAVCSDDFMCSINRYQMYRAHPISLDHSFAHVLTSHNVQRRMAPGPSPVRAGGKGSAFTSDGFFQHPGNVGSAASASLARPTRHNMKTHNVGNRQVVSGISVFGHYMGYATTGTCQCHPKYQIYDKITKTCRNTIGAPCDLTKENASSYCVEKGVCKPETGVCECEKGYVESSDGQCDIAYGEKCDAYLPMESLMRHRQFVPLCDVAAQLVCKGGKCACSNELDIYDPEKRECAAKKGARCFGDEGCRSGMRCIRKNMKVMGRCGP